MAEEAPLYTLHYFPFSLYSIMARFGFALGETLSPETAPRVDVRLVNLDKEDNISEDYLTTVNQKGQVPALTSPALPRPIDDSLEIAKWLCGQQPVLLPEDHKDAIERLMEDIYDFHAGALAAASERRDHGIPNQAAERLENKDISGPHRRALEIKSLFHETYHSRTLEQDNITNVEEKTRRLVADLDELLAGRGGSGPWLFGDKPTILDAHAAALMARLIDMTRDDLLSDAVREYTSGVRETEEWKRVTLGRPTVWEESIGSVAELSIL